MKVAILLNTFPLASEVFIYRQVLDLKKITDFEISLVITEGLDRSNFKLLPPLLIEMIENNQIELVYSLSDASKVNRISQYSFVFLKSLFSKGFYKGVLAGVSVKNFLKSKIIYNLIKDKSFDLIHAQYINLALSCVLVNSSKSKIISSIRGFDISRVGVINQREVELLNESSSKIACVLPVSGSLEKMAQDRGLNLSSFVFYSGLNAADFHFLEHKYSNLKTDSKLTFVQVGRLVEKKGYEYSLRVLAELHASIKLDFKFEIIGDGPLRESLISLSEKLGIGRNVTFHGKQSNAVVKEMVQLADFMLVPSVTSSDGDSEGIPNVIKEAMLLGTICIASDHSGIPEVVYDELTGFMFVEGSLESFKHALIRAIRCESLDIVSCRARQNIFELFDIGHLTKKQIKIYQDSVESPL